MIDTHSHLLPGLDHGCPDINTGFRMAAEAAAAGVTKIVCTPHLTELDSLFVEQAREVLDELQARLTAAGIVVELLLGFEVDLNALVMLPPAELQPLAIEGSKGAILVETPQWGWPTFFHETIFRLSTQGFVPVLAHPERNDRIQATPSLLTECLEAGAVAQATAASTTGEFGRASKTAFYRHVFCGDIALLASDAHSHRHSTWTVAPVLADLSRRGLSPDDLDTLVSVNPGILLSGGRPAPVSPDQAVPSWRRMLRRPH